MTTTEPRDYETAIRRLPARQRKIIDAVLSDPDDPVALAALRAEGERAQSDTDPTWENDPDFQRMVEAIEWERRTWATWHGRLWRRVQRLRPGRAA